MSGAVVFPGLAPSTFAGVGDFMTTDPYARRRLAEAEQVLGYRLLAEFRHATEDRWEVLQAAFLVNSLALADRAEDRLGMDPAFCVGLSFGGLAAAIHVGGLGYADALLLTHRSALLERQYLSRRPQLVTFCLYQVPLPAVEQAVAELREAGEWIEISAYLHRDVYTVCAAPDTIERFKRRLAGASLVPLYTMRRPIHCSALRELRQQLADGLYREVVLCQPRIPVVSDIDGRLVHDPEALRRLLLDGYVEPVVWPKTVAALHGIGVETLYVVGPRNLFSALGKSDFKVISVTPDDAMQPPTEGRP